jgi:uncharacterized repeat protein (TIGR02543 family)
VNIAAIPGVTPPVTGVTPVTTISGAQYTGTVTWAPAVDGTFAALTPYTATITLTAKDGFTLQGVAANFFTVEGATTVSNAANSGVITAAFPATAKFSVSFNSNGGTEIAAQNKSEGEKVEEPEEVTKEGYTFGGWYADAAFTTPWDFAVDTVTRTMTLYAKWTVNTYTITFDSKGGSAVASIPNAQYGTTITKPEDPTNGEFFFGGWYRDDTTFANQWNFANDTVPANDVTLYAQWMSINDLDFGVGATMSDTFNVSNESEWNTACTTISGGGNDKNYIINVTADFSVAGRSYENNNFGSATGIKVSLRSGGHTLTLSSSGNMICIGSYMSETDQSVSMWNVTLKGIPTNNKSLVYVGAGSTFTMNSGEIFGNTSTDNNYNGGVYVYEGTFTMNGGEISGNTNTDDSNYGGGVYLNRGTFTMRGGEISGNTSPGGGGGVYMYEGTFTMEDGEISGNISGNSYGVGGGVLVRKSTFTMQGGEISGNTVDGFGGGVYVSESGAFTMRGGKISGNTATGSGGGVYVNDGTSFTMEDGEVSHNTANTATGWGGGGGVYVTGAFTMRGGKISGNTATDFNGGGVCVGAFTMENGEISNNTATNGGGVYVYETFRIVTGTIYGNEVDVSLRNTATSGAALSKENSATAQRGTFTGEVWNKAVDGDLVTTDKTIKVKNGNLE